LGEHFIVGKRFLLIRKLERSKGTMFDRRLVKYFDWGLLGMTVLLGFLGLVTLYSAVTSASPTPQKIYYFKQLVWYCAGLIVMVISFLINYKLLDRWANAIYAICILLLICVLLFGKYAGGARRWLILGPLSIQPSEFVKIAVIICLARYYSKIANIRGLINDILAGFYQCRNGDGTDADCRCAVTVYQLWRLINRCYDDLHRPLDERKHAAFYVRIIGALPKVPVFGQNLGFA
jgi:hypothetical protein